VPVAVGIGVTNFVGAYVPYLGAIVGGAVAVLLAFAAGGPSFAIIMLVVVLVVNLIVENALQPKLLGNALELHPLVVIIVTVLGGVFGGLVGLILAAPLTAIGFSAIEELAGRRSDAASGTPVSRSRRSALPSWRPGATRDALLASRPPNGVWASGITAVGIACEHHAERLGGLGE
jgi:putative heme transporter